MDRSAPRWTVAVGVPAKRAMTRKPDRALEHLIKAASAFGRVAHAELAHADWSIVKEHRWDQHVEAAAVAFAERIVDQPAGQVALHLELDWLDEACFTLLRVRNRITDYAKAERGAPGVDDDSLEALFDGPDAQE